jgi:hypothetical protein
MIKNFMARIKVIEYEELTNELRSIYDEFIAKGVNYQRS